MPKACSRRQRPGRWRAKPRPASDVLRGANQRRTYENPLDKPPGDEKLRLIRAIARTRSIGDAMPRWGDDSDLAIALTKAADAVREGVVTGKEAGKDYLTFVLILEGRREKRLFDICYLRFLIC